jgi:lipopolysaccharide export system protein LptC
MGGRRSVVLGLLALVAVSWFWLHWQQQRERREALSRAHRPDYYLEGFNTIEMGPDGLPKRRLKAARMEHFADDNTLELTAPELELSNPPEMPWRVVADHAWVSADRNTVWLRGKVTAWRDFASGGRELEVVTEQVKVLVDKQQAETEQHAILRRYPDAVMEGVGMRASLLEHRLELFKQVKGRHERKKKS